MSPSVWTTQHGQIAVIHLSRPERRNAVDRHTADALLQAIEQADADPATHVLVLHGEGGVFCAGADLKALCEGAPNRLEADGPGPMGPTRLRTEKPVIAAIEGHAVAGGLELALWADLRVAAEDAVLGVFCRRWGVPLIDGGTMRLPRLIGQSRAMDLILTGRPVSAQEAERIGLVNRLTAPGQALAGALELAGVIAAFPQECVRADLHSTRQAHHPDALAQEFQRGMAVLDEAIVGATRFADGAGRHGSFED